MPHNMVSEVEDTTASMTAGGQMPGQMPGQMGQGQGVGVVGTAQVMPGQGAPQQSMRNVSRDRWGDIYANMPVKRMIALYDYDPQELSPNVDAEVSPISRSLFALLLIRFAYKSDEKKVRQEVVLWAVYLAVYCQDLANMFLIRWTKK